MSTASPVAVPPVAPAIPGPGAIPPAWRGMALGVAAAVIWGLYLALARQGVSTGLSPVDISAFRYIPAGLVMAPWLWMRRHEIAAIGWGRALVLTALAGPPFILLGVGGYHYAPLAHGAVIQPAIVTSLSMVLAAFVLGEKPSVARIVGVGVILTGIAVIAGPGLWRITDMTPLGDAMFAAAGVLWAVFTLLSRRWQVPPVAGTAMITALSAIIMIPLALGIQGIAHYTALPTHVLLTQIGVQGVLTGAVSVIAYTTAVRLIGPAKAAIFPALVPASAILMGIPVAGEWPTGLQIIGLLIVSAGLFVALGIFARRQKPAAMRGKAEG